MEQQQQQQQQERNNNDDNSSDDDRSSSPARRRDCTHEDDCSSSTGAPSTLLVDYHQPPTQSADEGKPPPPPAALVKYYDHAAGPNSSHQQEVVVVQPQEQSDHTRNETPQQTRKYDSVAKTSTPEEEGTTMPAAAAAAATEQSPTQETETHRAIPTTAVLNLSPYQRAQLAHWHSIFVQTRNDANDTTNTTTANRDNHHDDEDENDIMNQDVEYKRAVRQLREHMERMKEEQERKLLRSSVARAPSEAAVQVVDLTGNDDDDHDVVIVDQQPADTEQQEQQPQQSGIKRKLPEDQHAAISPTQRPRDAVPVITTVAVPTMPLSTTTTTTAVLGGDLPSEAPALPVPAAPTQDERILAHQLLQAQQDYDNAKAVYSTKLRHYHVLVAQLNNYASLVETGGDTTNLNLLSRQISIFRPFLLEAKAKVNESELRLQQITRHLSR